MTSNLHPTIPIKKMVNNVKIGDLILGKRLNRKVTGKIIKIHPGSVVIENIKNEEELVVIDSDKIIKIIKKRK